MDFSGDGDVDDGFGGEEDENGIPKAWANAGGEKTPRKPTAQPRSPNIIADERARVGPLRLYGRDISFKC